MRRAVSEQIKALAELNEIVARQGRGLDVAAAPGRVREPAPRPCGGASRRRRAPGFGAHRGAPPRG